MMAFSSVEDITLGIEPDWKPGTCIFSLQQKERSSQSCWFVYVYFLREGRKSPSSAPAALPRDPWLRPEQGGPHRWGGGGS